MDKDIEKLVEMGASAAQARAALKKCRDFMEAAAQIFEGRFDDVMDNDEDMQEPSPQYPRSDPSKRKAALTPQDSDEEQQIEDYEDDENEYDDEAGDYDYDSEPESDINKGAQTGNADPYAGMLFSKDRREEVIEVEEDPERVFDIAEVQHPVMLMTQSQWMKGCPEGGEQGFLFSIYNELSQGRCACPNKCGYSIPRQKSDFFPILPSFSTYVHHLRRIICKGCKRCTKNFCLACGEQMTGDRPKQYPVDDDDSMFHCPNLQGVLLGVGLFMLEQIHAEQNVRSVISDQNQEGNPRTVKRRRTTTSPTPESDEYEYVTPAGPAGKKKKDGTGYAGLPSEDTTGQDQALVAQQARDMKISQLLKEIRVYLPSVVRGKTSDYLVHPTTLAHLRRRFNCICSSLLRNDSLADMSDRSILYFELFQWLETISRHEALASMMAMPIMVLVSTKPASRKSPPHGNSTRPRERILVYEGSSGPRELLESIYIQADAALKSLEGTWQVQQEVEMTEEEKRMTNADKGKAKEVIPIISEENAQMLAFCRRIQSTVKAIDRALEETKGQAFVDRLHASLPRIPGSNTERVYVQAADTEEGTKKTYIEWATRARFEYCDLTIPPDTNGKSPTDDDLLPHYKFYYNSEARMMARQDIPKRSLAIAKELAVLTTNLPVAWDSSIFLRVDESRVDVIKALIIGPEGTPYGNGCFLFDIFLPSTYNSNPPHVKYMTTHGGKFRFNPNLYADGKVCLSLLGTWTGPGWMPGKSTLLQVLISIQSMILCEEPYLNEPGWSSCSGTPQSKAYSANVRRMVVKTAMLGNLNEPPEPFEDVIHTHFRLKARYITAQLDKWLEEDDGVATVGDAVSISMKHSVQVIGPGNHDGNGNQSNSAGGSSSGGFRKDVEDLKNLLNTL